MDILANDALQNNGRLAMLGIFGFLVADKIPGALPTIASIAKPYSGEVMNPFQVEWGSPFVMVSASPAAAGTSDAIAAKAAAVVDTALQVAETL